MAFFITFEGIEGSGKTTQVRRLAEHLRGRGRDVLVTREPGGCPIADAIRRILLDSANGALVPRAELLLYAAARSQHVDEVIEPALQDGKIVICDRFTDATLAYQGYGRGLDPQLIGTLNALAAAPLSPELTLLLDMPEEEGLRRARARNVGCNEDEGRFEGEELSFHRRVREGYLTLAADTERFRIVDARGSEDEVAGSIREIVDDFLERMGQ